jgi:hypothetical protein
LENVKKGAKGTAAKEVAKQIELLEKVNKQLEDGKPARALGYDEDEMEIVRELHLLTMKPMLYVVNVDEDMTGGKKFIAPPGSEQVEISAKLEAELAELSKEESAEYLKSLGLSQTGLDKLVLSSYKLLNLITFLTSGEPETRAWTVKSGSKAPEAAGVIHTDFIKGFIKADVVNCSDFVEYGGWSGIKTSGRLRLEGKDYIVKDGDVVYFHIA